MAALCQFSRQIVRQLPGNIGSTAKPTCLINVRTNCHRASITRTRRQNYIRTYPVKLVKLDGSAVTIRYGTPRLMLVMPENLDSMTMAEKKVRYRRMDPPKRVEVQAFVQDEFEISSRFQYLEKMKKK